MDAAHVVFDQAFFVIDPATFWVLDVAVILHQLVQAVMNKVWVCRWRPRIHEGASHRMKVLVALAAWLFLIEHEHLEDSGSLKDLQFADVFHYVGANTAQTFQESGIHLKRILVWQPLCKQERLMAFPGLHFDHDPVDVQAVQDQGREERNFAPLRPLAKVEIYEQGEDQLVLLRVNQLLEILEF